MAAVKSIRKILIANRGEIACRVMRTARKMGIRTVAVYSAADRGALHAAMADEAHFIGPPAAAESYLNVENILAAAKESGSDAVHPGYGFLAENADFSEACAKAGLVFIGPTPAAIRAMGWKDEAKRLMERAGVPVVPGYHGKVQSPSKLLAEAKKIGFPVLVKATAGGGGKGMRKVDSPATFHEALKGAQREAEAAFANERVLLEKYIASPRHIEVQVFGDAGGNVVHLFERDCSLQRRHQKVIEEAPAPGMTDGLRKRLTEAAVKAARAIHYQNAGTIEFIVDGSKPLSDSTPFYFIEMNTRLQVEHPATEMVTGLDLVEWQIRAAEGHAIALPQSRIKLKGHAVEARLYAEDPDTGFLPQTGTLHAFRFSTHDATIRVETGFREGDAVSVHYDPMLAKVIAHAKTRGEAIEKLSDFLGGSQVAGVKTNLAFLKRLLGHPAFRKGNVTTHFIGEHSEGLRPKAAFAAAGIAKAAAAALVEIRRKERTVAGASDPNSPWASPGWHLNASFAETFKVRVGDQVFEIKSSGKASENKDFSAVRDGDAVYLMKGGETFEAYFLGAETGREEEAEGPSRLRAPMPGKILEVRARNGAKVEKGAALVVMEAMKMEYTLRAPKAGRIAGLSLKPGDQVNEGALILDIEGE